MPKNKINTSDVHKNANNYIVGIGASAGGLEAIQHFLTALPDNTGFPYIIVQHLSPDYKSLLCEILSRNTSMPVIQAEDGMLVEPNHVYVIQPGKNMQISDSRLRLSAQKEHELNLPIDMFFRSLAKEGGSHAIAIVLSGTGSDGSNGLRVIKEYDGLTLVQDLDTAKFDGMPKNAMRTGSVDAQMSPEMMATEITHIASSHRANEKSVLKVGEDEVDEELIKKVYIILKKTCDVNFTHYKRATILRRMERRMMLTHKEELSSYVDFLYESPEEAKTLSKEILIGVTSFFRDPEFFQTLKEKVIQNIILNGNSADPIRIWVAGCSTGEEAYSIAILFCEALETLKVKRTVKIFATDLDAESIDIASKGSYSDSIIDAVSVPRLSRYFTMSNSSYTVKSELRRMIIFSTHNVFQDPPFGRLDLISCRNMMIYFQPVLQNELFNTFHIALKDKGYLFLGKSEAVGSYSEAFPVVDAVSKIFTHNSGVKYANSKRVPFLQTAYIDGEFMDDPSERLIGRRLTSDSRGDKGEQINPTVLEQFLPGSLVIDDRNKIIHTYGDCSNYIHVSVGAFSNDLYDMLTESLKVPVSTIMKEVREKRQKIQYKDICFAGEDKNETICLTAVPLENNEDEDGRQYALVFLTDTQHGVSEDAIPYNIDSGSAQRITDLEQYLQQTQEKLEKSVAEQDCVNEELQSTNEELLTANEELQSSNEELQSVNEELYTVNAEYQEKLTELSNLNDDIANFLSSTLIGIIFIDKNLNIRRFTDYMSAEFSVMTHDIGRSIKFISYNFPNVDFTTICSNVLKTLSPDDREVSSSRGKVYLMRVAPYRSVENTILGCVITLVDITTQKLGLVKLQDVEQKLNLVKQTNAVKSSRITHLSDDFTNSLNEIVEEASAMYKETVSAARNEKFRKITSTVANLKAKLLTLSSTLTGGE